MSCPDDLRHEFADTLAEFWKREGAAIEALPITEWPTLAMLLGSFSARWLAVYEGDDESAERDTEPADR